jgi:hypothetical protein
MHLDSSGSLDGLGADSRENPLSDAGLYLPATCEKSKIVDLGACTVIASERQRRDERGAVHIETGRMAGRDWPRRAVGERFLARNELSMLEAALANPTTRSRRISAFLNVK